VKVSICRFWLELPDYQYIILHEIFKQSAGVTPHVYLTQRRVERAREMLVQTNLPLAEIAFAVGFFDQGHLARHFRHLLGKTPREFRWSQR
jgi:transcriptional regulator GlxA family with amidase domain